MPAYVQKPAANAPVGSRRSTRTPTRYIPPFQRTSHAIASLVKQVKQAIVDTSRAAKAKTKRATAKVILEVVGAVTENETVWSCLRPDGVVHMRKSVLVQCGTAMSKDEWLEYEKMGPGKARRRKFVDVPLAAIRRKHKLTLWSKATPINGKKPDEWRRDKHVNLIRFSEYGKNTLHGWDLGHIKDAQHGGATEVDNLMPEQQFVNRHMRNHATAQSILRMQGYPHA